MALSVYVLYGWCLFNMIRARFRIAAGRAMVGVILALLALIIIGGVGFALFIVPFRKAA